MLSLNIPRAWGIGKSVDSLCVIVPPKHGCLCYSAGVRGEAGGGGGESAEMWRGSRVTMVAWSGAAARGGTACAAVRINWRSKPVQAEVGSEQLGPQLLPRLPTPLGSRVILFIVLISSVLQTKQVPASDFKPWRLEKYTAKTTPLALTVYRAKSIAGV